AGEGVDRLGDRDVRVEFLEGDDVFLEGGPLSGVGLRRLAVDGDRRFRRRSRSGGRGVGRRVAGTASREAERKTRAEQDRDGTGGHNWLPPDGRRPTRLSELDPEWIARNIHRSAERSNRSSISLQKIDNE